jgi:hypothetical protein
MKQTLIVITMISIIQLSPLSAEDKDVSGFTGPLSLEGGWQAEFFNSEDCTGKALKASLGSELSFMIEWDRDKAPAPGITPGKWSLRASATVKVSRTCNVIITVGGDDGFRFTVDGRKIIDKWVAQPYTEVPAALELTAGRHAFVIELFEKGGGAALGVFAEADAGDSVPQDSWKAGIYNSFEIAGKPAIVQDWSDGMLDFDWGYGAPSKIVASDRFSVRASRTIDLGDDGYYDFRLTADDNIRLRIDGAMVMDYWNEYTSSERWITPWLTKGKHTLSVDFREDGGGARLALSWKRIEGAFTDKTVLKGRVRLPDARSAEKELQVAVYASSDLKRAYFTRIKIGKGDTSGTYALDLPPRAIMYHVYYYVDDPAYALRGYLAPGIGTVTNPDWSVSVEPDKPRDADLDLIALGTISGRILLPAGMKAETDIPVVIQAYIGNNIDYFANVEAVIPEGSDSTAYELRPQISGVEPVYSVIAHNYSGGFVRHLYWSAKGAVRDWTTSAPVAFKSGKAPNIDFTLIADPTVPSLESEKPASGKKAAALVPVLAPGKLSEFERALVIFEWISGNLSYCRVPDFFASEFHCIIGPMTKKSGDCEAYSQTLIEMLKAAGIEAKAVAGGGHVWIQARINGNWYYLESSRADRGDYASYGAFLVNDEQLARLGGNTWDRDRNEACPWQFALDPALDIPHLASIPSPGVVRIIGSVKLPEKATASRGFMYTIDDYDFWFSSGENESFFILPIPKSRVIEPLALRVRSEAGGPYVADGYYASGGLSRTVDGAVKIDLTKGDVTGITVRLMQGARIEGVVTLPGKDMVPSGGVAFYLNLYDADYREIEWPLIRIREGEREARFAFTVRPGKYLLGINGGEGDIVKTGFFSGSTLEHIRENATVYDIKSADDRITDVKLELKRGKPFEGKMVLPAGYRTPDSGLLFWIDWFDADRRKVTWQKIVFSKGQYEAPFVTILPAGSYYLRMSCPLPDFVEYQNVGRNGPRNSFADTPMVEAGSKEARSLVLAPVQGVPMSGSVRTGDSGTAPAGGITVVLVAWRTDGEGAAWLEVTIPAGKTSAAWSMPLLPGAYIIGYSSVSPDSFVERAYYGEKGMTTTWSKAKRMETGKGLQDIDLYLTKM